MPVNLIRSAPDRFFQRPYRRRTQTHVPTKWYSKRRSGLPLVGHCRKTGFPDVARRSNGKVPESGRFGHLYCQAMSSTHRLLGPALAIVIAGCAFEGVAVGQTTPTETPTDCSGYASVPVPAEADKAPVPRTYPACAIGIFESSVGKQVPRSPTPSPMGPQCAHFGMTVAQFAVPGRETGFPEVIRKRRSFAREGPRMPASRDRAVLICLACCSAPGAMPTRWR
jgi:hypothetical protein